MRLRIADGAFCLSVFWGALSCTSNRSTVEASDTASRLLGADREATFRAYVADIRDGELISEKGMRRLHTTWDAELERVHRRFLVARSKEDVYYALRSLTNSIHDRHSQLTVPDSLKPDRERLELPFKIRPDHSGGSDVRWVVSESTLPGVGLGAVLERYQGRKLDDAMREFSEWYGASSPELRELGFAEWLTARESRLHPLPKNRSVELTFRAGSTGTRKSMVAEFASARIESGDGDVMSADADYAELRRVFDGLNYRVYADDATHSLFVRYSSFDYDFDAASLWNRMAVLSYKPEPIAGDGAAAARRLAEFDVEQLGKYLQSVRGGHDRIVVDIRENAGGDLNVGLLQLLATRRFRITTRAVASVPLMVRDPAFKEAVIAFSANNSVTSQIRQELAGGAARSSRFSFRCATERCAEHEAEVDSRNPPLGYRVILLIGPGCVSSCDQFAAIFSDNHMGVVVGLPTAGASAPFRAPKKFVLADGSTFSITLNAGITYRPNGEVLEGNPVLPSIWLYPGRAYMAQVLQAVFNSRK